MPTLTKPPGQPSGLSGLLSIDQVAAELSTNPLAVKRLIARRRLPANRLGEGREWRVASDALQRYVNGGASDFNSPPLAESWFAHPDRGVAIAFPDAAKDAMREQVFEELPARLVPDTTVDSINIEVTLIGAVSRLLTKTVPQSPFAKGMPADARNWRDVYLTEELRKVARRVVSTDMQPGSALEKLYASPDDYDRIVQAAETETLERRIPLRQQYNVDSRFINVWYVLTHAQLAQSGVMNRVREAAF